MTNDTDQQSLTAFEKRAQEVLRADTAQLSPEINDRLVAMRRAAVQELDTQTHRGIPWVWAPAGAMAIVVIALGLFLYTGNAPVSIFNGLDAAQLAAAEDMELLEELEFLAWMEEEAANAG